MTGFPEAVRIPLPPHIGPDGREESPITLAVHDAGSGPAVVLCHGFPELAFSWRKQFQPLVDAGFRVIAPDMRGYGGSDRPDGSEAYDIFHLTGDMVGLLDALSIDDAVFAGHDWGGFVVWAMGVLQPGRTAGIVGVNTPYLPRGPLPPTQMLSGLVGGDIEKHYILWFQKPGVAEAVLDGDPGVVFDRLLRKPPTLAEVQEMMASGKADMNPFRRFGEMPARGDRIVDDPEMAVYVETFARTGFGGGISWYRNFDRNWEMAPAIGVEKIEKPCLMVTAERDFALPPAMAAGMPGLIPDLETVQIDDCGHWTQQEKAEEFNRVFIDWLCRRFK